jgi:hypothetical protein
MITRTLLMILILGCSGIIQAQDDSTLPAPAGPPVTDTAPGHVETPSPDASTGDKLKDAAGKLVKDTKEEVTKIAKTVDESPTAKTVSAGILQPIYTVARSLSFGAFHWVAFSLMAAGVVSYTLQLVLGKLVVLMRMGLSFKEIASDAVGLAISVVGLVLTTQAAAENSTFTQSPAAVISAAIVGALAGFVLYLWGQSQELDAAAGRARTAPAVRR